METIEKTKIIKKRKSLMRIFGDFMTILTVIGIFVFSIFCISFIIFTLISSPASAENERTEKSPAEKFQKAMQYTNSLRNTVDIEKNNGKNNLKVGSFELEPEKVFINPKTQKNWYTDNPAQTGYYSTAQSNAHGMEKDAIAETTKDEDYKDTNGNPVPTPGKTVINSFQTRPIYKLTQNDDYITKSNQLIKNSKDIVTGTLNNGIKCRTNNKDSKKIGEIEEIKGREVSCETAYEQKTCNEEIRAIKRIREEAVEIAFIDDPYPGCQRHTSPPAIEDCLAGGVQIPHYRGTGYGKVVLPKNRGARVGFSDSRHPYYYITATNDTTGELVIPRRQVSNGYYIELPISKNQDQTFSFVVERWDRCTCDQPGRMNIYINYMRKIPKVEWREVSSRDI